MVFVIQRELSRKYYFAGPDKEFPNQNAAQRHAEWKEGEMKRFWGEKFVSSKILAGRNSYQVEVKYETDDTI